MATSCTPYWRCNADATGCMTSAHPTVAEGVVTRTVCFRWDYCCYWSTNIFEKAEANTSTSLMAWPIRRVVRCATAARLIKTKSPSKTEKSDFTQF